MAYIRAVKHEDINDLMEISAHIPRGMTNLPVSKEKWQSIIENSILSFDSIPKNKTHQGTFLIVLIEDNKAIGTGAIFSPIGVERPFYTYKVTNYSNLSPEINKRVNGKLLHLVNDYDGTAEVGTLFLHPDYRGGGRGSFLSYSRFLIIASHYDHFPDNVMAEIRGWEDEEGRMPFWEAVGSKFFQMSFDEADKISTHDFRFISDLFPRIPVYVNLLPKYAQEAIAKPNTGAKAAYVMLQKLGFRYNGSIDIFDAGPCLDAPKSEISLIKNSYEAKVKIIDDAYIKKFTRSDQRLASTKGEKIFKTFIGYANTDDNDTIYISKSQADELTLDNDILLATKMG